MTNEVTIFFRETIRSTFDDTEKAKQQQHGLFKGQRYLSYWYKVSCHNKGKSIKYEPWVIKKSTVYMSNRNEIFISKINREKSWFFFFAFSIFFFCWEEKDTTYTIQLPKCALRNVLLFTGNTIVYYKCIMLWQSSRNLASSKQNDHQLLRK